MIKLNKKFYFFFLNISFLDLYGKEINNNKITIDKIEIKPLTLRENDFYLKIANDERVRYQSLSFKQETLEKKDYFKYKLRETNLLLQIQGIFLENTCIGYIGFFKDNTRPNILFIYYAVLPKYWGKGICTLAVEKIINNFKDMAKKQNFNIIKGTIKINNIGSQKVLEKNKFKPLLKKNGDKLVKIIDGQSIVYEYEFNL
jgi:RimJ/RimL family protein N-acetyltransferase